MIYSVICLFLLNVFELSGYFEGGLNYTIGKKQYIQQEVHFKIGSNNIWFKPSFFSWKSDNVERMNNFGIKIAFEKPLYLFGLSTGYTPKKNNYESFYLGSDLTYSFRYQNNNPNKISGSSLNLSAKSVRRITQLDLGAEAKLMVHKFLLSDMDLKEINITAFTGVKIFLTQLTFSYAFSSYDKEGITKIKNSPMQKIYGLNSVFPYFIKSAMNTKIVISQSLLLTPYFSYTKVNTKTDKNFNIYALGFFTALSMVNIIVQFESYKDNLNATQRYLSFNGNIKF